MLLNTQEVGERDMVEVCPDAALIARNISERITECGGAMLVVDYGHSGTKGDTFRVRSSLLISNIVSTLKYVNVPH